MLLPSWVLATPSTIRRLWLACSHHKSFGLLNKECQQSEKWCTFEQSPKCISSCRNVRMSTKQRDAIMHLECLLPGCPLAHSALPFERALMLARESYSKQFHIQNHSSYLALNLPIQVSCTSLPPLALACQGCHSVHHRMRSHLSVTGILALAAAIFTTSASDVGICINLIKTQSWRGRCGQTPLIYRGMLAKLTDVLGTHVTHWYWFLSVQLLNWINHCLFYLLNNPKTLWRYP